MILKFLSYPRSLLMSLVYPFYLLFMSSVCVLQNLIFNRKDFDSAVLSSWARGSCWMFGVRVRVESLEKVPRGGCVYLFNHTSFFDIFAMAGWLPDVRFGAKIELFQIPVFGFAMKRIGVLPIDRAHREKVFGVYRAAEERLKNGEKFALAPEGTRQNEEKLGPFKAGPFVFAISTGVPVVPIVIQNAASILPKHHYLPNWGTWSREIVIRVLDPLPTGHLKVEERPVLQNAVREKMSVFLQKSPVQ